MEQSTLASIFYFVMSVAGIVIIGVMVFFAYYGYRIIKRVEDAGARLVSGFGAFEESIKKLSFLRSASKTRRKSKAATPES